jgi:hypothetical protein
MKKFEFNYFIKELFVFILYCKLQIIIQIIDQIKLVDHDNSHIILWLCILNNLHFIYILE